MTITVRYMAQIRHAAGAASEHVELREPCGVHQFVRQLAAGKGESLRQLLLDSGGQLQPTILLFVGDAHVSPQDDVSLRDGDTVTLLSPISGG